MTRRREAENMLCRYGETVICKGEKFKAMIRPVHFTSSPDDTDFLYTGPVSHKLTSESTVTSYDGADYIVKRYKTVIISGEELYVRAVLTRKPAPDIMAVHIERGGAIIARATGCTPKAVQDTGVSVPYGGNTPSEIEEGTVHWELVLTGIVPENGADIFSTDTFSVVAGTSGKKTAFTGCRWKSIESQGGMNFTGPMAAVVLAAEKEVAPDG